jgi:hypothetical protein
MQRAVNLQQPKLAIHLTQQLFAAIAGHAAGIGSALHDLSAKTPELDGPQINCFGTDSTPLDVRFSATCSVSRAPAMGRQLPTVDVGCPDAQLGSQLSGGEIAHPAVAGRPSVAASVATPMPAVQRKPTPADGRRTHAEWHQAVIGPCGLC